MSFVVYSTRESSILLPPLEGQRGSGKHATMRDVTLNQLLRIWARRWYVLTVFAAFTSVAIFLAVRVDGIYWTRVDVVFLAPSTPGNQNTLRSTSDSLVDFAAIVERQFNGNERAPRFSSTGATLYGAGVRKGYDVTLPNSGGQWSTYFADPVLTVDVVDSSEEAVRTVLAQVVGRINALARQQQLAESVPPSQIIQTLQSPQSAVVSRVAGNRLRAAGGILLLGASVGGAGTVLVDRVIARRRSSA
jgi:hypothetical protein